MNYLAHFYLSFGDKDLLTGQFIADAVKGKSYEGYPQRIREGILLHRFVDHLTDIHPACRAFRADLRTEFGLYAPVVLDIYLDHILARDWSLHHDVPLEQFTRSCYDHLLVQQDLPPRMAYMLRHMSDGDWLSGYAHPEGIRRSLHGLSRRVPKGEALALAADRFTAWTDRTGEAFNSFFPDLHRECREKIDIFAAGLE